MNNQQIVNDLKAKCDARAHELAAEWLLYLNNDPARKPRSDLFQDFVLSKIAMLQVIMEDRRL